MNVLDLFSGIGGFSLGLERAGMSTIAFCEIEQFCQRVLAKHFPGMPIYSDIKHLRGADLLGPVDVVCGGFPCQPFSTASRGRRVAADLWPEMLRLVDECRPGIVIAENVQEQAIANAADDLRQRGFGTYVRRIAGSDLGADHQRNRWWVVAHAHSQGELHRAIDAEVAKLPEICRDLWGADNYARAVRIYDGIPDRVDGRLAVEALGNAVFPQIPEAIGRAIMTVRRDHKEPQA